MLSPQQHSVFVDANVLYSRTLRDWLAKIYLTEIAEPLYRVFWTEDVLAETIANLRKQHPSWSGRQIVAAREHIVGTFVDGRVSDFVVDPGFDGRDVHDAHVHSAALACEAHILLTCNGKDFLPRSVDPDTLPYEIYHPDEFFVLVDDSAPDVVREVTASELEYWLAKHGEVDLPLALRKAGAPEFSRRVAGHIRFLGVDRV